MVDLARLAHRLGAENAADPFLAQSWREPAEDERRLTAPPPTPQAPPLPFTYLGKLVDGPVTTVFMSRGDRNWALRPGDTVEDTYRIEAIGERGMTLTYLPLALQQELGIGEPASSFPPSTYDVAAATEALPAPASSPAGPIADHVLLLAAPSRVATGDEFVVRVALPRDAGARVARLELSFDHSVLAPVARSVEGGGRIALELSPSAPLAQVRFKVIGKSATSTRITIENPVATDERGAAMLAAPQSHAIVTTRVSG